MVNDHMVTKRMSDIHVAGRIVNDTIYSPHDPAVSRGNNEFAPAVVICVTSSLAAVSATLLHDDKIYCESLIARHRMKNIVLSLQTTPNHVPGT